MIRDNQGQISTMRVMCLWGAAVGTILALGGLLALFFGKAGAEVAMGTGAGLFSVGELTKALQKQAER